MFPKMQSCSLILINLILCAATACPQEPSRGSVRLDGDVELRPNGDGFARVLLDFAPADYTDIKGSFPNAYRFLRDFSSRRSNFEIRQDAVARYDDARSAVVLELTEEGCLFNRGAGRWQLHIERGADFVHMSPDAQGATTAFFYETGTWPSGITYKGQVRYHLPAGATETAWKADERLLRYTLSHEDGQGNAVLSQKLQVKKRLMSAIYKVYGLGTDFSAQWVAKSVFKNEGASTLSDVRVRYRLSGYSDWSMWQKFPEMVPGQTVVSNYYPVLSESIARLSSNTPANLLVEWRFSDRAGQIHTESDGRRLILLGMHEYIFSNILSGESFGSWQESTNNAPLIAAWVSRDDTIVKQFAALASHGAGGTGANSSPEATLKVLRAIYELLLAKGFCYQHPPSLLDRSVRFDVRQVQNVKFPRDVIRDRAGTCIDLAILYAAMANSVGISPCLALVPGHAFPVFKIPGGGLCAVEATGVRGGLKENQSVPFETAFKLGNEELRKWMRDGRMHLLDLRDLWTRGISNPELPPLPADVLRQYGLSGENTPHTLPPENGAVQNTQGHQSTPPPDFGGTWVGRITQMFPTGQMITYPASLTITALGSGRYSVAAQARARIPYGYGMVDVEIVENGAGSIQNGHLLISFRDKTMTYLSSGQRMHLTADRGALILAGATLSGRVGNDVDGWINIAFARR